MRIGRAFFGPAALVALCCVTTAATGQGRPAPQAAPKSAQRACHLPHAPGEATVPLTSAGVSRPFLLFVPSGYDGRKTLPLVLNLHGSGGSGSVQMEATQMAAAADRRGVAVAAPNGAVETGIGAYAWNVPGVPLTSGQDVPPGTPDDERYLLDVIRTAGKTICIDSDRVYLTGYSGGARMTSQMGCDYARKIAAIAPVDGLRAGVPRQTGAGTWEPDRATCKPREALPVRTFHGTADTTNPFDGNDEARWGYSVETALARWAKLDHCRKGPASSGVTGTVSLVSYRKCDSGSEVQLYLEDGGGHTWPGSSDSQSPIDATDLILKFFRAHALSDRD